MAKEELRDLELINDKLLRLIVNAFLVRRYGIPCFQRFIVETNVRVIEKSVIQ